MDHAINQNSTFSDIDPPRELCFYLIHDISSHTLEDDDVSHILEDDNLIDTLETDNVSHILEDDISFTKTDIETVLWCYILYNIGSYMIDNMIKSDDHCDILQS